MSNEDRETPSQRAQRRLPDVRRYVAECRYRNAPIDEREILALALDMLDVAFGVALLRARNLPSVLMDVSQ